MIERQFAWVNSLPESTYGKLDRVLMDTGWEYKFPLVPVQGLELIEALSDHAPILLPKGTPRPQFKYEFKFELGWLHREGFSDMVKKVWEKPVTSQNPI
jgi:hypothetical protein